MTTVYLINKDTRIVLPPSQWGKDVLTRLSEQGHVVEETDQNPWLIARNLNEHMRVARYLDSTGL
jgi:hypothetical protein